MSESERKYVNGHRLYNESDFTELTDEQKECSDVYRHVVIGGLQQCTNCGAAEIELTQVCRYAGIDQAAEELVNKYSKVLVPGFMDLMGASLMAAPAFDWLNLFSFHNLPSAAERHGVMKMDWKGNGWPEIISLEHGGPSDRRTYIHDKEAIKIRRKGAEAAETIKSLEEGHGRLNEANRQLSERVSGYVFTERNMREAIEGLKKEVKSYQTSEDILKRNAETRESQFNYSYNQLLAEAEGHRDAAENRRKLIEELDSEVSILNLDKSKQTTLIQNLDREIELLKEEKAGLRDELKAQRETCRMLHDQTSDLRYEKERLELSVQALLGGNTVNVPRYQLRKVFHISLEQNERFVLVDLGRTGAYFNDPVILDYFTLNPVNSTQMALIEAHVKAINSGQATKTVDPETMPKTLSGKYAADLYEEYKVEEE